MHVWFNEKLMNLMLPSVMTGTSILRSSFSELTHLSADKAEAHDSW